MAARYNSVFVLHFRVSRETAASYLTALEGAGFFTSQKIGKESIYLNKRLFDVVQEAGA
ncbi:MAG: hypothetical protein ABFD50_18865 [Smithella sp.]